MRRLRARRGGRQRKSVGRYRCAAIRGNLGRVLVEPCRGRDRVDSVIRGRGIGEARSALDGNDVRARLGRVRVRRPRPGIASLTVGVQAAMQLLSPGRRVCPAGLAVATLPGADR